MASIQALELSTGTSKTIQAVQRQLRALVAKSARDHSKCMLHVLGDFNIADEKFKVYNDFKAQELSDTCAAQRRALDARHATAGERRALGADVLRRRVRELERALARERGGAVAGRSSQRRYAAQTRGGAASGPRAASAYPLRCLALAIWFL